MTASRPQITSVLLTVRRVAPGSPSPKSFSFPVRNCENCPLEHEGPDGGALPLHGPNVPCMSHALPASATRSCAGPPAEQNQNFIGFPHLGFSVAQKITPAHQGIDTLDCETSAAASGPLRNYSHCLGKKTGALCSRFKLGCRIFDWDSYTAGWRLPQVFCLQQLR